MAVPPVAARGPQSAISDNRKITRMFFLFFFIAVGKQSTIKKACYKVMWVKCNVHSKSSNKLALSYCLYLHILTSAQARLLTQVYLRPGCSRQRLQAATLKMCSSPTCLSATCCVPSRYHLSPSRLEPVVFTR